VQNLGNTEYFAVIKEKGVFYKIIVPQFKSKNQRYGIP